MLPQSGVKVETFGEGQKIVLLASVPMSNEGWLPLAEGEAIVVKDAQIADAVNPVSGAVI